MRKISNKRGLSPVIATLLLVVIVIVLALLIFFWAKMFIKEALQKKQKPVDQVCQEIKLTIQYESATGALQIQNIGNYPIYDIQARINSGGNKEVTTLGQPITIGSGIEYTLAEDAEEVEIIPIILAENSKGKKTPYTCQNNIMLAEIV